MIHVSAPVSLKQSVLDWFVLSGVTIEGNDQSIDYTQIAANQERALDEQVDRITQKNSSSQTSDKPMVAAESVAKPSSANTSFVDYDTLKFESLTAFNAFVADWKGIGLCKTASKAVLGTGQADHPNLAVIADFPDDVEDRTGTAFSGGPHAMIMRALHYAGISKDSTYITYLSKWRPPARRALASHELDVCAHLLKQELNFVQPDLILVLGESCLKAFEPDSTPRSIAEMLGKSYVKQMFNKNITIYSSHRGEFLVKNGSMKRMLWNSLLDIAVTTRAKGNNA